MSKCLHCPKVEINARNLASGKMKARVKVFATLIFTPSVPTQISSSNSITAKAKFKNYGNRRKITRRNYTGRIICPPDPSVASSDTNNDSSLFGSLFGNSGVSTSATPYQSGLNTIEITTSNVLRVGQFLDVPSEFFNKSRVKILDVVRSAKPIAYYRIYTKLDEVCNFTDSGGFPNLALSNSENSFPFIISHMGSCYQIEREGGGGIGGDVNDYVHFKDCIDCFDNVDTTTTTIAPTTTTTTTTTTTPTPSAVDVTTTTIAPTTSAPLTSTTTTTTTPTPSAVLTTTAAPYSPGYGYDIGPIFGDTGEHFGNSNPVNRTFARYEGKKTEYTYTVIIDGYALSCVDGNVTLASQIVDGSYLRAADTLIHGIKYPKTKQTQLSVKAKYIFEGSASQRISVRPKLETGFVDRVGGHYSKYKSYNDFQPVERLYPSGDLITSSGNVYFINESGAANDLYRSINEGVFTGNYFKDSSFSRVSDDLSSYVMPSAILTKGNFKYKFEVTAPTRSMDESFLVIRASAPMQTYTSDLPPVYTLSNLRLEDPSGNLITQYKDIVIRGDAKYSVLNYKNFATYFSEPEKNHANLPTYDSTYPIFGQASGYTLNVDVNVGCLDDPFADGFSFGFEDTCVPDFIIAEGGSGVNNYLAMAGAPMGGHGGSDPFIGVPTNNLRISAIEILSSGGLHGYKLDNLNPLSLVMENPERGLRGRRDILPAEILANNFDTTIHPSENTLWSGVNNLTNTKDYPILTSTLRNNNNKEYLELISTSDIADSGKLKLRFSHETPTFNLQLADGAFSFGNYKTGIRSAKERLVAEADSFFTVDEIELKIVANKAAGTRDYVIDVVGYSDDKLLQVTQKVGGFLQNASGLHPSGLGVTPVSSGFGVTDEIGIASEAISDKFQYFESSGTNNMGGDHYSLPSVPVVNSTEFVEYTIPLKIYQDKKLFGKSTDYSMSTYFENLFLDIYPFPSGAKVSHVALSFTYKPSQALPLATLGHSANNVVNKGKPKAFPVPTKEFSSNLNASFLTSSGLSLIEQIPHGYKTPSSNSTLKTNYSRRWRGVDGNIVNGAFNPTSYDYSFYNPQAETPFLSGFYSFNNTDNNFILSDSVGDFRIGSNSGEFNGNLSSSIIDSVGFRLNSSGMFPSTQQRSYKTIDWTPANHELNGRILDSFDRAIRVSGNLGNIDFGSSIPVSSGFSAYVRFSPDITISGSSYNFWNSGVLLSKWDSGKGEEFSLGYSGGFLCGRATASGGNNVYIQDTQNYTNYQYPLSVLLTYNDSLSSGLKLYVDSEIDSGNHNILRASSAAFAMSGGNSNIVAGYAAGSGVGINAFITDFGIGSYNASGSHIVESGNLKSMQQTTAESFFSQYRVKFWNSGEAFANDDYKLWSFVDKDVDKWHIGAFSICQFNQAYDRLYTRVGSDFINYNLTHDGQGYEQKTNIAFPSEVLLSGLAYHSQIENDMLRLNIGTIPEDGSAQALYSPAPRIVKSFPRGYDFSERSFVVETILQNFTNKVLTWPDSASGAKLIVSLYAPHKDVVNVTSGNYGLVNRHTHYLEQSGCFQKISSTFDYNDWIDKSEPWSKFDKKTAPQKFAHEYYSQDVEKMFIQYDLAYPSGTAFHSNIKLHSINLKMENAVTSGAPLNSTNFTLYSSGYIGENIAATLQVLGHDTVSGVFSGSGLSLSFPSAVTNIVSGVDPSGMLLAMPFTYASGPDITSSGQLGLMTSGDGVIGFNPDLVNYGEGMFGFVNQTGVNPVIPLSIVGKPVDEIDFASQMPLYVSNNDSYPQSFEQVNFFMPVDGIERTYQDVFSSFFTHGTTPISFNSNSLMPLYINNQAPKDILREGMVLNVSGSVILPSAIGSTNLFTQNYPITVAAQQGKSQSINWTNENTGSGLLVSEEDYSYLEANDEIRGVDVVCFGSCDDSKEKCIEEPFEVHSQKFGGDCVEGGIFRAKRVYTNIATSGFKTDIGYSGNYYGIRKYVGLIPDAPYVINAFGQTGSSERKELPRSASVEYGSNGQVNFSGIKLVADGIAGASGVTSLVSDSNRHVGDKFGKAVSVKGDYMVVGSPHHHLQDESGYDLGEAGSIFVYKREPEPSGYNWDYHKAGWSLETKLHLPSGHKRDYKKVIETNISVKLGELPFAVKETEWYTGQEGRQLGHSVDMSSSGTNPVIVAGAPNSKWTRTFDDPPVSGVDVALIIFTRQLTGFSEEFFVENTNPWLRRKTVWNIVNEIEHNNLLFKYFCNPSVELRPKVIICEPITDSFFPNNPILDTTTEGTLFKFEIHNMDGEHNNHPTVQEDIILEELKQIFNGSESGVYKYDASKRNNGIPAIVACLIDDSQSMGESRALGNAVPRFQTWLEEYSKASGLLNILGQPTELLFKSETDKIGVNWVSQGESLVKNILNTGTLFSTETSDLFADNLGTFRTDIDSFNLSPVSGGSVFIFQQEMNNGIKEWNTIQEIQSPTAQRLTYPDRFGHSVAISDDAQVIIIGSPYMNDAIQVYNYDKDINPASYVGTWLNKVGPDDKPLPGKPNGYIYEKYLRYNELNADFGNIIANQTVYDELSSSGKFQLVKDENIEQYKLAKSFSYNDFKPNATKWEWLYSKFVPTSRLGYSVAVNEDGTMFAAGAPTDSIVHEEFNNFNLWWRPSAEFSHQWFSSVNAGSVRIFESREYYPHNNKAVEFTKFGNLHRKINHYKAPTLMDHMKGVYDLSGKTFERLPEDEVDIPNDAGLAFIITPELDALSDEILDNIQNWLGLGDRHLVLVGDDPKFEEFGLYSESNEIINDLLSKLDSRMRIRPASGDFAALIGSNRRDDVAYSKDDFSITPAFVPRGTTNAVGQRLDLYGSGVGSIKLHYKDASATYSCSKKKDIFFSPELDAILGDDSLTYSDMNNNCNIPIAHEGDMRSEWNELCMDVRGKPLIYPMNLALFFGTKTYVGYGCDPLSSPAQDTSTATYEPIPLLTSAEYITKTRLIPAIPDSVEEVPVYHDVTFVQGETFDDIAESGAAFYWSSTGNNYNYLEENIQPTFASSRYELSEHLDIPDFTEINSRTSILRSTSQVDDTVRNEPVDISDFIPVARENYKNTTSQVYLIGSTEIERLSWLEKGINSEGGADNNLRFYRNLLQGVSRIASLGGWTGRTSLSSAQEDSAFNQNTGKIFFGLPAEGSFTENLEVISNQFDALWIASTHNTIDDTSLRQLKNWLSQGNKKLYITIGQGNYTNLNSADQIKEGLTKSRVAATNLCDKLELNIRPLFLTEKNKYADSTDFRHDSIPHRLLIEEELVGSYIDGSVNEVDRWGQVDSNPLSEAFGKGYVASSVGNDTRNDAGLFLNRNGSTPIDTRNGGVALLSTYVPENELVDDNFVFYGVPQLKTGVAKVNFPVIGGSGYRIFIDTIANHPRQSQRHQFKISNCTRTYGRDTASGNSITIKDIDNNKSNSTYNSLIPIRNYEVSNENLQDFIGATLYKNDDNWTVEELFTSKLRGYYSTGGDLMHEHIDIYVPTGIDNISIYIDANRIRDVKDAPFSNIPETSNLVGVSGALIGSKIVTGTRKELLRIDEIVRPGQSERTEVTSMYRPISTNSLKYCPTDECLEIFKDKDEKHEIEDGPIVAAQEVYHQRTFNAGVNRSRITVLSDASMIQGPMIANEELKIHQNVKSFLLGLYPETEFPDTNQGKQYNIISRITAPVKGSPHKFFNATGNSGNMIRFAGDGTTPTSGKPMTFFSDAIDAATLDSKDNVPLQVIDVGIGKGPRYIIPDEPPFPDADQIERIKLNIIASFDAAQYSYGGTSKFSGIVDGELYGDAYYGNVPRLLGEKDIDYLDFDKLPSGYPGDLFGYSLSFSKNQLLVGQPFGAFADERSENPITWAYVSGNTQQYTTISGAIIGYGGGAGAAYLYDRGERTLSDYGVETQSKPWTLNQKFRPSSINVGQDLCLNKIDERYISTSGWSLGSNNYTITNLAENSFVTDQFGLSVELFKDLVAIGAPGHDFGNFEELVFEGPTSSGAFNLKEFSDSIDIPERNVYDLGESGVRYDFRNSGILSVLNAGAAYVYENNVTDWENKIKRWKFNEKIVAKGHNSRIQKTNTGGSSPLPVSGSENDYFGRALSIYQNPRKDSDYAIGVGVPNHQFATSGNHISFNHGSGENAGAVYQYDVILRTPDNSVANTGITLEAKIYGDSGIDRSSNEGYVSLNFANSGEYDKIHEVSGLVYSNSEGEIFLEVSGQDPSSRGFITHRPFVQQITGKYLFGTPNTGLMRLYTSGRGSLASGSMNLFNAADSGAIVYNNVGMHTSAVLGSVSGVDGSGLGLFIGNNTSGIFNSGLTLMSSGGPIIDNTNLILRVRGM